MLTGEYHVRPENIIYASFDLCALLLATVVLVNYVVSKKIDRKTSRLFGMLNVLIIVSAFLNLLAIITMSVVYCPAWVGDAFTVGFYLSYIMTGVVFLVYSTAVVYENVKIPKWCYVVANSLCLVGFAGVIFAAVCLFGVKPNVSSEVYANFKLGYEAAVYGVLIISLIVSLGITILHVYKPVQETKLKKSSVFNITFFCLLNIVAVFLQYFVRSQVSTFALSLAILLIYITLQRPEDETDAASGAFNARTFNRRGQLILNEGKSVFVFALEINNMTVVNSSFGLNGGNQVIKQVADRLKKLLVKGQYLYRLSGVRFATFFRSREAFDNFSNNYASVFERPFSVNETEMRLTATACVIAMPEVTEKLAEVEDLLRYYRNSINVSEEIIEADSEALLKARRRELVDFAVQNAISNGTFEVYYQPIYSVKDKTFSGCEALIRLNDPTLGFISPDEFIPIAEQNGKIIEVGKFVIDEVCRFIKEHNLERYGISFVDINLSVIQCMHPEIINDIESILRKYEVPRSMVNLEITETASAQSYAMLQSKLNELHSNGFTISLDDFGTGFSSVEYLIDFPFDVVKLDKALVWAYMSTKKYEPILQHYMPMLHSLGTRIVAEGVETQQMVDALISLGCDFLQGYYYSRPINSQQFLEFISKNNDVQIA